MDILTLAVAKNSASSTPGQKGDTGNGIKSTVMNDDYTLTIEFTDGTSYTTPSIRGEKGETGSKGAKGDKGDTGAQGIQGIQGEKGDKGETGENGKDGSDASVTTENITKALGYTPANQEKVSQLSDAIVNEERIAEMIDEALGVIENGYY